MRTYQEQDLFRPVWAIQETPAQEKQVQNKTLNFTVEKGSTAVIDAAQCGSPAQYCYNVATKRHTTTS